MPVLSTLNSVTIANTSQNLFQIADQDDVERIFCHAINAIRNEDQRIEFRNDLQALYGSLLNSAQDFKRIYSGFKSFKWFTNDTVEQNFLAETLNEHYGNQSAPHIFTSTPLYYDSEWAKELVEESFGSDDDERYFEERFFDYAFNYTYCFRDIVNQLSKIDITNQLALFSLQKEFTATDEFATYLTNYIHSCYISMANNLEYITQYSISERVKFYRAFHSEELLHSPIQALPFQEKNSSCLEGWPLIKHDEALKLEEVMPYKGLFEKTLEQQIDLEQDNTRVIITKK